MPCCFCDISHPPCHVPAFMRLHLEAKVWGFVSRSDPTSKSIQSHLYATLVFTGVYMYILYSSCSHIAIVFPVINTFYSSQYTLLYSHCLQIPVTYQVMSPSYTGHQLHLGKLFLQSSHRFLRIHPGLQLVLQLHNASLQVPRQVANETKNFQGKILAIWSLQGNFEVLRWMESVLQDNQQQKNRCSDVLKHSWRAKRCQKRIQEVTI